jgi:hypothetical protein
MILLNAFCFFFSLWVASTCQVKFLRYFNLFAAFLNFAVVIRYLAETL